MGKSSIGSFVTWQKDRVSPGTSRTRRRAVLPRRGEFRLPPGASRPQQIRVFIAKHLSDNRPGMIPLVEQLIKHPAVGMLGNDAAAEQLKPHPGYFFDEARIVQKPPAAKDEQIAVFFRAVTASSC